MSYDARDYDAVYQIATGQATSRTIWRHPIVEVTETWVKAQNAPVNVDPDEDKWAEEAICRRSRKADTGTSALEPRRFAGSTARIHTTDSPLKTGPNVLFSAPILAQPRRR